MDELKIADGSSVADLGAGGGWFTIRLARRVGPNGLVYAEDIQPPMVEVIEPTHGAREPDERQDRARHADRSSLPPKLDAVLIVVGYREMDEPDASQGYRHALRERGAVARATRMPRRGRFPSRRAAAPGRSPRSVSTPEEVIATARAAGLKLLARETIPPFVFLLVFGKETSRCASAP